MNKQVITVVAVSDTKLDCNSEEYRTIQFEQRAGSVNFIDPVTGEDVLIENLGLIGSINGWNPKNEKTRKNSVLFNTEVGKNYFGDIVSRPVIPYDLVDKSTGEVISIDTFTAVVFGDSSSPSWEGIIEKTFRREGRPLKVETQVVEREVLATY